ncbi:pimeloyl-ACP methyl ester carboxylesterase [Prosthecomicrobium pneumaticum]|uniref:Pimeloyl-ACP methyl ester carboxylesterase n=1 Tax=Prosthecomicrobium pneumaticum TaxID=81895 RepID=A0A7W9CTC9_9HYPH|nr:pimeloyl-ACP methyl ester carboxylesterase [Prosthecomicrobium pneumaticum]
MRDFEVLATALATDPMRPRRVLALDSRGRGASERDPDPSRYQPGVELADALAGLAARGLTRVAVVGTSRGGILAMLMAAVRPDIIAGAVLVDIGSRIETAGLMRIKSYVGRGAAPSDWAEAARALAALHGAQFPAYGAEDWAALARLTFRDVDGRPEPDYDPALASTLDGVAEDTAPLDLSAAFAALAAVPTLVIRGGTSDLLTAETVEAMATAHPGLEVAVAPGEGHPPMLRGALVTTIAGFLLRLDERTVA